MNGDIVTPEELELRGLKSQVAGLQVNRDALFEENKRFRSELAAKDKQIKELKSELEGRMDDASEAIYQLQQKIQLAKEARKDLRIEIVQLAGKTYYWALMCKDVQLAHSREVDVRDMIEPEADAVAAQLGLPVIVNERS